MGGILVATVMGLSSATNVRGVVLSFVLWCITTSLVLSSCAHRIMGRYRMQEVIDEEMQDEKDYSPRWSVRFARKIQSLIEPLVESLNWSRPLLANDVYYLTPSLVYLNASQTRIFSLWPFWRRRKIKWDTLEAVQFSNRIFLTLSPVVFGDTILSISPFRIFSIFPYFI